MTTPKRLSLTHFLTTMGRPKKQSSDRQLLQRGRPERQSSMGSAGDLFRDEYRSSDSEDDSERSDDSDSLNRSRNSRHYSSTSEDEESTGGWSDTSGVDSEGEIIDTVNRQNAASPARVSPVKLRTKGVASLVIPKAEPDAPMKVTSKDDILALEDSDDDDSYDDVFGGSMLRGDKKKPAASPRKPASPIVTPLSPVKKSQSLKSQMSPMIDNRPTSPFSKRPKNSKNVSPTIGVRPPSPPAGSPPRHTQTTEAQNPFLPMAPNLGNASPQKRQAHVPSQFEAPRPVRFKSESSLPTDDILNSPKKDEYLFDDDGSSQGSPKRVDKGKIPAAPFYNEEGELEYDEESPADEQKEYYDEGPQYISRDPANDRYYDPDKDPRYYRYYEADLPVHRAEYPDADPEAPRPKSRRSSTPSQNSLGKKTIIFDEEEYKRDRRLMVYLVICLSCSILLLGLLAGGLVGAAFLQTDSDSAPTSAPDSTTPTTVATTAAATTAATTTTPTVSTPVTTQRPPIAQPTPTTAPTAPPTVEPTTAPTAPPTVEPTPAPQVLFDLISAQSSDQGAAMLQDGTPQNLAFQWIQNEDPLVTQRRNMRGLQSSLPDHRILQRYALMTIYYALDGPNWARQTNWRSGANECDWQQDSSGGNLCDFNSNLNVLEFSDDNDESNLLGELPPEIGMLTSLSKLSITNKDNGGLTGALPSELGLLTSLNQVVISRHRDLVGAIPSELFAGWKVADVVDLSGNGLTGSIPSTIGELEIVRTLTLQGNSLSQGIPTEIGRLSNVEVFSLAYNSLIGNIPIQIGGMTSVSDFNLGFNQLDGPIPPTFSDMVGLQFQFDVQSNKLSGDLPDFTNVPGLQRIWMSSNRFSGNIPESLAVMTDLRRFEVQDNDLFGNVSSAVCGAFNLRSARSVMDCTTEVDCPCCWKCCTDSGFGPQVCVEQ